MTDPSVPRVPGQEHSAVSMVFVDRHPRKVKFARGMRSVWFRHYRCLACGATARRPANLNRGKSPPVCAGGS